MNLREQLKQNLTGHLSDEKTEIDVNIAAKIAEDFAISFAEWITNEKSKYSIMYGNQEKRFADFDREYTSKELLEIFKKES